MRNEHINDILNTCSLHTAGSPVDKLIALIKHTENINCVYLIHKYDTSFYAFLKE
jgi:hypothetical protein